MYSYADEILWYELCENTPSSAEQSTQHFGELANALQMLHHYKKEWSEDDVISIIDEITSKDTFHSLTNKFRNKQTNEQMHLWQKYRDWTKFESRMPGQKVNTITTELKINYS